MTISTRTPEGTPNRCPVCGHAFRIEPSRPFGDAPCPTCGTLLWFVTGAAEARFFDPETAGPFRRMILGVDRKHRLCLRTETGVDYEIPYAIES